MAIQRWFKSVYAREQIKELKSRMFCDSVFDGAAALSFYLTISIFPGLIFLLTLLPYLPLPDLNAVLTRDVIQNLPPRAAATLESTVWQVLKEPNAGLLSASLLGALIAASSGTLAVMKQINLAYSIRETRSLLKTRAVAIVLTLMLLLILLSALLLIVVGGRYFPDAWMSILRWVILLAMIYTGASVIYFLAPNQERLHGGFRYFTPGSWWATLMIAVATWLLGGYGRFVTDYNKIYGSLAGVVVLMFWFYLVGMAIISGAQLNHFARRKYFLFAGLMRRK